MNPHRAIHVVPAPWYPAITTQAQLKAFIKANKEFHTASVIDGYGRACTPSELIACDYTHISVRYGARNEKQFYTRLV